MRRLSALVLLTFLAAACSGTPSPGVPTAPGSAPGTSGPGTPTATATATAGEVTLAAATGVQRLTGTPADAATAGAAVNRLALDLYAKLHGGDGNLVISPTSIALSLAMARAGARGTTAAEMDKVLHGLGSDADATAVASLDRALNDRAGQLRVVNAPFAQRDEVFLPAYLEALAARFDAGVRLVDYKTAPESARGAINAWVADQTNGRIPQLLPQGTVDALTRLVLVNAVYLDADWQDPFNPVDTSSASFRRADGSEVGVQMMLGGGLLPYARGKGWQAVQLPYVGGQLAMLVILPDDVAAFESSFDAAAFDAVVSALTERTVTLELPRFGANTQTSLAATLAAMGMPTAFSPQDADFSGITTTEPLFISAVVHQANIDVGEKGTVAAAATGTVAEAAASQAALDPVSMTVDHPFLFALRDLETGAVLFLGRISDASVGAPTS